MRYVSVNKLTDFEFHDAEFTLESFENSRLTVKANYVNIHKNAEQNPHEADMEIDCARIVFTQFQLKSYEPGRALKQDETGKFYNTEPQIILSDDVGYSRLLEQLNAGLTIYDLGIKEENTYFIDAMSKDPFFTILFSFDNVSIEWDEYKKEAWYTSRQ